MKTIGLTGGIGSGKTTVSQIFEQLGVPVFCCDAAARDIQDSHPDAIAGMKELFGGDIYAPDGRLNRRKVASIAFADPQTLHRLNALIHPLVRQAFTQFATINGSQPLILMESAILIQSGFYKQADFCVQVTADTETRIARVMQRDGISREEVVKRIANQLPDSETAKLCKYIIHNDNLQSLTPQVQEIINMETAC